MTVLNNLEFQANYLVTTNLLIQSPQEMCWIVLLGKVAVSQNRMIKKREDLLSKSLRME